MILAVLLVQAAATVSPPAMPPQDWSALPPLTYRVPLRPDDTLATFVRDEVNTGRCAAATPVPEGWAVQVEVAALVDPHGHVRRLVPRAIQCPTVEQYAVGALSRALRDNVPPTGLDKDVWLKTSMRFAWK